MKVSATYLLPNLNVALLNSAVLVQAYSYKKSDPVFCDVTFPLKNVDDLESSNLIDLNESLLVTNERDFNSSNLHLHPLISYLGKEFNLYHSCGIVRLILIDNPMNDTYRWVPYEILYGIPLFDFKINKDLCLKIEKFKLFQKESLQIFTQKSRQLVLNLLDFIIDNSKSNSSGNENKKIVADNSDATRSFINEATSLPTDVVTWTTKKMISGMKISNLI